MINRRTKWYLAAVTVLGVMLVIDRAFLAPTGGPAEASAATSGGETATADGPKTQLADALRLVVPPFPKLADLVEPVLGQRDPFALSPLARRQLTTTPAGETNPDAEAAEPLPITSEQFSQQHQLSAVLQVQGEWRAIIDDVLVGRGQRIDDCVITQIEPRSVTARCGSDRVSLVLKMPLDQ